MDDILRIISEQFGLSLTTTSLLLGLIVGFMLGKVGKAHVPERTTRVQTNQPSHFSKQVGDTQQTQINLNGQNIALDSENSRAIYALLRSGKTVDAIKLVREATNLDLKTAKDVVEGMQRAMALRKS